MSSYGHSLVLKRGVLMPKIVNICVFAPKPYLKCVDRDFLFYVKFSLVEIFWPNIFLGPNYFLGSKNLVLTIFFVDKFVLATTCLKLFISCFYAFVAIYCHLIHSFMGETLFHKNCVQEVLRLFDGLVKGKGYIAVQRLPPFVCSYLMC